ncbi:MAG: Holliday junction branch migration DNA helicase RuvB [Atopobiaceae bacterium]|nr:Holliday junction branch migration DNA helicase RuvB [Atopobiaceae bacterium]MBQ6410844.1 Holliday junction branch migration DNA helicase RuvB [Atopobiaceae bacterium]MBR3384928.1 Holliday junction branch migration DNA helicase RuvB [Atopobiaceae bacterium]
MWQADADDLFGAKEQRPSGPRSVTGELTADDLDVDRTLRPRTLDEYQGQTRIKENLRVLIEAAKSRNEPLDHVIFSGPPGLGKTTLAAVLANEMGTKIHTTSGPAIERTGDLAAILTNLEPGDILFIDEIHRLNHTVEEVLYPAMEDFSLDIMIGKGPAARSIRLELPRFTLVGATTRTGLLTGPLRDRFGISYRLDYYSVPELADIVVRSAGILGVEIDSQGAAEVASRSRGTPRLANRLLKRVRDYAQVRADGNITWEVASEALSFFEIDELGLDWMDVKILRALTSTFRGRPVGLTTIASAVGEDPSTLEDVYEPYLLQRGLIIRTPQGRRATAAAFEHLGMVAPQGV